MRKLFVLLIFIVFLLNLISALDCQYKDTEVLDKQRIEYYLGGDLIDSQPPFVETTGLWDGKKSIGTTRNYEFYPRNTLAYEIGATVTYNAEGRQRIHEILLDPFGSVKIEGSYSQDLPFFDSSTIRYDIKDLGEKVIRYTEEKEICLICPNGKQCLNDGASCQFDKECGYGECNALGVCGPEEGACPAGKKFNGQICVDTFFTTFKKNLWWMLLALGIFVYFWFFVKRMKLDKKLKELELEGRNKLGEIRSLEIKGAKIAMINSEREKLIEIKNQEIKNLTNKREILQEKVDNARGELKTRLEKELKDNKKTLEEVRLFRTKIQKEVESSDKYQKKREEQAIKKYCGSLKRGFINENGYVCWKDSGKPYHTELYKKRFHKGQNEQIHHIDQDKLNNELWNLIAIDKDKHRGIHGKTKDMSWRESLNYLLTKEIVKKDALHPEIKKKLKRKKR